MFCLGGLYHSSLVRHDMVSVSSLGALDEALKGWRMAGLETWVCIKEFT